MSTYVSVKQQPLRISVICTDCQIDQPYNTYNRALNECKAHRLYLHPEQIDWVG